VADIKEETVVVVDVVMVIHVTMVKEEVVVVVVVVQITVAMVVVAVATTISKATVIVSDVNGELTASDRECMAFNAGPGPPIQMSANDQGPDGLIYLCFTFLIGVPIVNCMICLHLIKYHFIQQQYSFDLRLLHSRVYI